MLVYQLLPLLLYPQFTYTLEVNLNQGILQGEFKYVAGKLVNYFLGIPYAQAPVGNLRFRPPQPHPGWQGSYLARSFKPACPQPTGSSSVRTSMSEDCLYLNVWTPELPSDFNPKFRPVLVVLEGQLFTLGNPEDVPADDLVQDQDLVVVSIAYRLNAFGFLSYQDPILPGNLGLWDQSLALQWVFNNIEKFGGDPNQITLLGHSSGAASVGYHLMSTRPTNIQRYVAK